jgi:hypothetical protein
MQNSTIAEIAANEKKLCHLKNQLKDWENEISEILRSIKQKNIEYSNELSKLQAEEYLYFKIMSKIKHLQFFVEKEEENI